MAMSTGELLRVEGGDLGPLQTGREALELHIRPLTVFIGEQGTGKSLLSQLLYFFRDAEYLLARYGGQSDPDTAVRAVVEGIRSGDSTNRALASFLKPGEVARISYIKGAAPASERRRVISIRQKDRKISPLKPFNQEVEGWLRAWFADPSQRPQFAQALFIPAERSFFSRFVNTDPGMLGHKVLPLTMREFSRALTEAGRIFQEWQRVGGTMPSQARVIEEIVEPALRGKVRYSQLGRFAGRWQWIPEGTEQPIEIEMASSGQMEAWPLVLVAQTLWGLPEQARPVYLHLEEPETHLHPAAQLALVKILAYLVNQGFHVTLTTHSLTVLYVLNNLMLASELKTGDNQPFLKPEVPAPELRLAPAQVEAYFFARDGRARSLLDREEGFISEAELGRVGEELSYEMNLIGALRWQLQQAADNAGG